MKRITTAREQFDLLSPWMVTAKLNREAVRRLSVHDRILQICAMADTSKWHPMIQHGADGFDPAGYTYSVISPDKKLLGELVYQIKDYAEPPEAKINRIVVHPAHQKQGIGQALIERLNQDYPEHKINPGSTTTKGHDFTERLRQIIPDAEDKIIPNYQRSEFSDLWTRRQEDRLRELDLDDNEDSDPCSWCDHLPGMPYADNEPPTAHCGRSCWEAWRDAGSPRPATGSLVYAMRRLADEVIAPGGKRVERPQIIGPELGPELPPVKEERTKKPVQQKMWQNKDFQKVKPPKQDAAESVEGLPDEPVNKEEIGEQMVMPGFSTGLTKFLIPEELERSVIDKYNAASDETKEQGGQWYDTANEYINYLAQKSGRDPKQVAAIMSAFSPRTAWDANMGAATHFIMNYDPKNPEALGNMGGLKTNLKRAKRIHAAEDEDGWLAALQGGNDAPKITNFYHNLMGDKDRVTIDSWMVRAMLGRGLDIADKDAQKLLGWQGGYDALAKSVQSAAKKIGISPRELQAIVWSHVVPTANYSEPTMDEFRKLKKRKEQQLRRNPPKNPQPDYVGTPGADARDDEGNLILPPRTMPMQHLTRPQSLYARLWKTAEPLEDAYDPRAVWFDDYVSPEDANVNHEGPWYHVTPHPMWVGATVRPSVELPDRAMFNYVSDEHEVRGYGGGLPAARQKWTWMDKKDRVPYWLNLLSNAVPPNLLRIYEVEPQVEGPWPYNGSGVSGFVSPRAKIVREIPHTEGTGGRKIHWPEDEPENKVARLSAIDWNEVEDHIRGQEYPGLTMKDKLGDQPTDGYMVSLPGYEEVRPYDAQSAQGEKKKNWTSDEPMSAKTLEDYNEKILPVLAQNPDNRQGGWADDGDWFDDVSRHHTDIWDAAKQAYGEKEEDAQHGFYDVKNGISPSPLEFIYKGEPAFFMARRLWKG
jgi:GNAT superfamily N-acetyltransferase